MAITHDVKTSTRLFDEYRLMFKAGRHPEAPINLRNWDVSQFQNGHDAETLLVRLALTGERLRVRGEIFHSCGDTYKIGNVELGFAGHWQALCPDRGGRLVLKNAGHFCEPCDHYQIIEVECSISREEPGKALSPWCAVGCNNVKTNATGYCYTDELAPYANLIQR